MSKAHKPVCGSRAYYPRKRAKRIYSTFGAFRTDIKEARPLEFAGYKAGMTQVVMVDTRKETATSGREVVRPVTILDCPPINVCAIKLFKTTEEKALMEFTAIWSEKTGKDLERKIFPGKYSAEKIKMIDSKISEISDVRLLVYTSPRESGIGKKKPEVFEIALSGDVKSKWEFAKSKLGGRIKVDEVFKVGENVDSKAVTIGKGFQGVVKRFGIKIRSRKSQLKHRHLGTMSPKGMARVRPNIVAQAGQMGFQTRTEYNKRVIKIGTNGINPKSGWSNYGVIKGDYIILDGSVPSPRNRIVLLRNGLRAKSVQTIELKEVIL